MKKSKIFLASGLVSLALGGLLQFGPERSIAEGQELLVTKVESNPSVSEKQLFDYKARVILASSLYMTGLFFLAHANMYRREEEYNFHSTDCFFQ